LVEGVKLEELILLFVVVVGADKDHNEHGEENCKTLDPRYKKYNIILFRLKRDQDMPTSALILNRHNLRSPAN
jgi:hypothetical protein